MLTASVTRTRCIQGARRQEEMQEMGSFTPLVFGTNEEMGNECQRFLEHLADKIAQKDTEPYNTVIAWLRTQIYLSRTSKISTCMRERFTNTFSQQDRTLLRL